MHREGQDYCVTADILSKFCECDDIGDLTPNVVSRPILKFKIP